MNLSLSEQQQHEMRHAFYGGAPGILVSGLVWLGAALVANLVGINQAVWTLLLGGALIFPVSTVLTRALGRPARTGKGNALNQLGMASTIWLILCCAMAYGLFLLMPALFFPVMLVTIGSRYLIFASMYGRSIYWLLGGILIVAGIGGFFLALPPTLVAGIGGAIEVVFACAVFSKDGGRAVQH